MKERKILYLMHVPWKWIKQRPHFLAEALCCDFEVKVIYKHPLKASRKNLVNDTNQTLNTSGFWQLPFDKLPILKYVPYVSCINKALINISIGSFEKFDYVWLTSLSLYPMIKHLVHNDTKLIWDCMDDEMEFEVVRQNKKLQKKTIIAEKELIVRANIIFCSSKYLSDKIQLRSGFERTIEIINNAVQLPKRNTTFKINTYPEIRELDNIFMYIGTISAWFDFECLVNMLEHNLTANVILVGPADIPIIQHNRIHIIGAVKHENIFELMSFAKVLIMPFIVNELIRSVNPVKLYEYIYANKIILAPRYAESEKFEDYIYLYNDHQQFNTLANSIIEGNISIKKEKKQNKDFAEKNQWINRYKQIKERLQ